MPGVVNLQGTAEDASNVYLLFTAAAGGDLYQRLSRGGLLSEAQLCREVCAAPRCVNTQSGSDAAPAARPETAARS